MRKRIYFDSETTGLDFNKGARMCSLSLLIDGEVECKTFYFNPECPVEPKASEVNGLTWDMLKAYPTFADQAQEIFELVDGAIMIAHNAQFDVGFLQYEFNRCGIKWMPYEVICTMRMAMSKVASDSYSLDAMTSKMGLKNLRESSHESDVDTKMCQALFESLDSMEGEDSSILRFQSQKEEIENALKEGQVKLTFTKKDGSLRRAVATLKDVADRPNHAHPLIIDFLDTEINEMRSFNLMRLVSWHKIEC